MSWEDDNEGSEPESIGHVKIVGSTDKALKVRRGTGMEAKVAWIPRSVVHDDSDVHEEGDEGEMLVKAWFAEKEGL